MLKEEHRETQREVNQRFALTYYLHWFTITENSSKVNIKEDENNGRR